MQNVKDVLLRKFKEKFAMDAAIVAYAPGRVEILGNHTDYNEGYTLSSAINFGTYFAVSPREDNEAHLIAGDVMQEVVFDPASPEPSQDRVWSNYVKGVLAGLNEKKKATHGFNAMFLGDLPLGAGLSSSAALEVSSGLAFAKLYDIDVSKMELARIGQRAEHEFAGVKCGLLDQVSSLFGQKDHLVWSDFRTYEINPVQINPDVCFLMCDTKVKHALVDGEYNERRRHCEEAAAYFASTLDRPIKALRDVTWEDWLEHHQKMDDLTARRAAHPIGENERVISGIEMLRNNDMEGFGRLMFESHESSRVNFENSCPELDTLVAGAQAVPGVLGARLSGGGFGGSAVVLAWRRDVETVSTTLRNIYANKYGERCDTRILVCSDGARVMPGQAVPAG